MNYKKEKNKSVFKIVLIILVIFLVIFTGYSIKYNRKITIIESVIKDTFSSIINLASSPFRFLSDKWEVFLAADNIYSDYIKLKEEHDSLLLKDNKINELENENVELRELLSIQDSILGYEAINATVIHRSADNWLNNIIIDKGKKNGIENDMAVIINGGLVGYISSASNYTSTVALLTSANIVNKISVRIEVAKGQYAYGFLSNYDVENNLYIIEGISDYHEIPISASVTTTGLTERFPGGILVGSVKNVDTDNYDLTKVVQVIPSVNSDDIRYVTVLKREASNK